MIVASGRYDEDDVGGVLDKCLEAGFALAA